jgi:hypothetical protein
MKYRVVQFKTLAIALKGLEKFVKNQQGNQIRNGKPLEKFGGLRPREVWANWLVCAAGNAELEADRLIPLTDPFDGDGVIWDRLTEVGWPTEHIMVVEAKGGGSQDPEVAILNAISKKNGKGGAAYASGKTLIVFIDAGGDPWFPNSVAKKLPKPLHFDAVWIISLRPVLDGSYTYNLTRLDEPPVPIWRVHIAKAFDAWHVDRIQ